MNSEMFPNELTNVTDYVVIDIETTSLSGYKDQIIQVAGVKVEGGKIIDTLTN